MDQTDFSGLSAAFPDAPPQPGQKGHVLEQRLLADSLRRRAGNEAAIAFMALDIALQDLAQTTALLLALDFLRHPGVRQRRHADQIARGDGDIGGQTRTLAAERILDHLHHQPVALMDQFVDLITTQFALRTDDIGGMQEGGPLQTDVNEGRLHPRQHPAYPAFVDIAHQSATLGAFDDDLLHHAVFDHGNPGLGRCHIDQDFFAHRVGISVSCQSSSRGYPLVPVIGRSRRAAVP